MRLFFLRAVSCVTQHQKMCSGGMMGKNSSEEPQEPGKQENFSPVLACPFSPSQKHHNTRSAPAASGFLLLPQYLPCLRLSWSPVNRDHALCSPVCCCACSALPPIPRQLQQGGVSASHTCAQCSSSSGSAFWFVRRSNKMSEPRTRMGRASAPGGAEPEPAPFGMEELHLSQADSDRTTALNGQRTGWIRNDLLSGEALAQRSCGCCTAGSWDRAWSSLA